MWCKRYFSTKNKYLRSHSKGPDSLVAEKLNLLSYSKIEVKDRDLYLQRWSKSVLRLRARDAAHAQKWAKFLIRRADVCAAGSFCLLKHDPHKKPVQEEDSKDEQDEVTEAPEPLPQRKSPARHVFKHVDDDSTSSSSDEEEEEEDVPDALAMEEVLLKERIARGLRALPTPPVPTPASWELPKEIELQKSFDGPPFVLPEDVPDGLDDNDTLTTTLQITRKFDSEVARKELLEIAGRKKSARPTMSFLTDPSPLGHVWLPHWGPPSGTTTTNALLTELRRTVGTPADPETILKVFHASPLLLGLTVLEETQTLGTCFSSAGFAPVFPDGVPPLVGHDQCHLCRRSKLIILIETKKFFF